MHDFSEKRFAEFQSTFHASPPTPGERFGAKRFGVLLCRLLHLREFVSSAVEFPDRSRSQHGFDGFDVVAQCVKSLGRSLRVSPRLSRVG